MSISRSTNPVRTSRNSLRVALLMRSLLIPLPNALWRRMRLVEFGPFFLQWRVWSLFATCQQPVNNSSVLKLCCSKRSAGSDLRPCGSLLFTIPEQQAAALDGERCATIASDVPPATDGNLGEDVFHNVQSITQQKQIHRC